MDSYAKKDLSCWLCICSFIIVSGCAHYKARPLGHLDTIDQQASTKAQESSLEYKQHVFSSHDCATFLDRNTKQEGYQPIHITLMNNSKRSLDFSLRSFNIACVPAEEVAESVHTDTIARAAGYGIAAVFMFPFVIPAIIDGIGSAQANQHLDSDFAAKALHDQVIRPYSTLNGLIFVPYGSDTDEISLILVDTETRERFVVNGTTHTHVRV